MKVVTFEDLIAWQKAQDLAVEIYRTFESQKNDLLFFCEEVSRVIVGLTKSIQDKIEVK